MDTKPQNDFKPETLSLMRALVAAGFTLEAVNNGGYQDEKATSEAQALAELTACDEACLFVSHPAHPRKLTLWLVLGNSPGELVADYSAVPILEAVVQAESDKWEDQPQPMSP